MKMDSRKYSYYTIKNAHKTLWRKRTYVASFVEYQSTVKLVYNDHTRDPDFEAVVDRWSLLRGNIML